MTLPDDVPAEGMDTEVIPAVCMDGQFHVPAVWHSQTLRGYAAAFRNTPEHMVAGLDAAEVMVMVAGYLDQQADGFDLGCIESQTAHARVHPRR